MLPARILSTSVRSLTRSVASSAFKYNDERKGCLKDGVLTLDGQNLTVNDLVAAGNDESIRVEVHDSKWDQIAECRKTVDRYAEGERIVYGVNTSCGGLVDHLLPKQALQEFQKNLVRCVATQVGDPFPSYMTRMAMIARINSLCRGFSGIKPENLKIYLGMVNNGVYPVVPQMGSLGTSGDLGPLACIAAAAFGEWKAEYKGEVLPAKEALSKAGLVPMVLDAKEGLSMINGTSYMAAVASENVNRAINTVKASDVIAALSIEGLLGRNNPFDLRVHEQKYHPGQYATAQNLVALIDGSRLTIDEQEMSIEYAKLMAEKTNVEVSAIPMEDAYAIRCTPQVVGPTRDSISFTKDLIERELNSTNDNPIILGEPHNTFIHNGHFHGQAISNAMDWMTISVGNLGVLSDRRVDRFMDPSNSTGLPGFLVKEDPGTRMGMMGGQFMTTSLVAELRQLSSPVSNQSITSTGDFQDIVSFGLIAARQGKEVIKMVQYILSFELMCGAQALDIRGVDLAGPASKAVYDLVRTRVPYFTSGNDKVYIDELEALKADIDAGRLLEAAESVVGPLWLTHNRY